jgi:predicted type IV restriction endonuclease
MQRLNFGNYNFRFRNTNEKVSVFDEIRKKFIILTPEEWVRQHVVHFLISDKKFPKSLINVEKLLTINGLTKRYDIVVFNPDGTIFILIECKAPQIKISQTVFDQIARYNMTMQSQFLMVTNGHNHYFCRMDYENEKYIFLETLPEYGLSDSQIIRSSDKT